VHAAETPQSIVVTTTQQGLHQWKEKQGSQGRARAKRQAINAVDGTLFVSSVEEAGVYSKITIPKEICISLTTSAS